MRFTLVTSANVSNNPRLVKEADALVGAGHRVRVVAPDHHAHLAARDTALVSGRGWRLDHVATARGDSRGRLRWIMGALTERGSRGLYSLGVRRGAVADRAIARYLRPMFRSAVREPADVIVAHTLQALPVAGRAAVQLGARLAFDIEDLHVGELADTPENRLKRAMIANVERRWLPRCDLLTASSDGIADEVALMYGVRRPQVVLNVFPVTERARQAPSPGERPDGARVSLYWYSQVVGRGRGLEEAVRALAHLPEDIHLSLRGEADPLFAAELRAEALRIGAGARLHLLDPVSPDALVARAAQHDIGLALEQPHTRNRQLCVTNKLFTYLLAGLAVAATDTEGQRAVMAKAPSVGFLCPPGDVDALAHGIRRLSNDPVQLMRARAAAAEAAATRFNWEREQDTLVAYLTEREAARAPAEPCAAS